MFKNPEIVISKNDQLHVFRITDKKSHKEIAAIREKIMQQLPSNTVVLDHNVKYCSVEKVKFVDMPRKGAPMSLCLTTLGIALISLAMNLAGFIS